MYACLCYAVTESELTGAIAAGARTEDEVGEVSGAGTGCGSCLDRICDRLRAADPLHAFDCALDGALGVRVSA